MASNTDRSDALVVCPTCDYSVLQAPGKKRTICPKCGNFYSKEAAEISTNYRRNRQHQSDQDSDSKKKSTVHKRDDSVGSGGRLQTISNFFQNLTPNSRRSTRSLEDSFSGTEVSNNGAKDSLPPIERGRMLTPSRGTKASYSSGTHVAKHESDDFSPRSSEPCGPNCVHHKKPNTQPSGEHGLLTQGHSREGQLQDPRIISPTLNVRSQSSNLLRKSVETTDASNKSLHPVLLKTAEVLKEDFMNAKVSGNWRALLEFYTMAFDSFDNLNSVFKRDPSKEYKTIEDPGLKFDFINLVFDIFSNTPQGLQKEVLKAVINSLLKDKRVHSKDDLRAFLILLQNPQFRSQNTYVIFAHLLRQIAALNDHDHHFLVHWLKRLKNDRFRAIIERIHNFISVRLFPPNPAELPHMSKCSWWIPSATKVLALLNAANNLLLPSIVQYIEFYNSTLDHLDLMAEYYAWQNPSSHAGFSFCQYPFILSIAAKKSILQKDSEQQMVIMARKSLVAKVQRRQLPDIGMLFLNLTVRRSHLVSDSLSEISKKQHDLKKKLKVSFAGEPGLDMGGLTKEWFLLLVRQIFLPNYGMFSYDKLAGVHWFSPNPCENYQEFNLVGVLMGLAVYNSINLDIRFPPVCYRKLLSPAVVPFNNPRATVGVCNVTLHDLKGVKPEVAKGLQDLLDYDGDVEETFCLTFEVVQTLPGETRTLPLKPGGENIPVTNDNRKEYVQLYTEWVINTSIYSQFQAFYHGFHSVCASNALIMLRPEEVETLVCGSPTLVMEDLKKVTVYDGFSPNDPSIKYFWDVVLHLNLETQKRLLLFATGSDRIPIGGMGEMTFKISRIDDVTLLPMSHTCFNQLVLPPYKSKKLLKQKLITAINNAEGFGLE
ncbi:probable E3 ubiquitin-protein ligase HECTD2 isoform X2 [Physella acuta]|uniref:probable E3 ubiquitin-protein ligase HECTD2 isoform X2 n=1 Tax=Physella acuta TaxID=109671 RepID=UPI0027DDD177|nr:probable E3 ubiquitin-protein ligase HECTD2 isoform X2 [Physella acuta]